MELREPSLWGAVLGRLSEAGRLDTDHAAVGADHDHQHLRESAHPVHIEVGYAGRFSPPHRDVVGHHRRFHVDIWACEAGGSRELCVVEEGSAPLHFRAWKCESQRFVLGQRLRADRTRTREHDERARRHGCSHQKSQPSEALSWFTPVSAAVECI